MRTARRTAPLAALAIVVVTLSACAPFKSGPGGPSLPFGNAQPQARELYGLVNSTRAAYGLGPLGWNDQLGALAQSWSEHVAATGDFSHQNLGALLGNPAFAGFSGLAENIMSGTCGMSAGAIHQAWMNSSQHRANILGNYSAIGIGVACNGGTVAAVEDFGR
jgi:uncharacterized protein YkwD